MAVLVKFGDWVACIFPLVWGLAFPVEYDRLVILRACLKCVLRMDLS